MKNRGRRRIKYPYAYDKKRREMAPRYVRGRLTLLIAEGIAVPLILLYAFIALGLHTALAAALASAGAFAAPLFAIALFTYMTLPRLPISFYSSYIFEHKFRLSRMTVRMWLSDTAKGLALGYFFTALSLALLFYFLQFALWWLYATVAYALFALFFNYIFPVLIFPLFYKTKPYRDKKQIARLEKMAEEHGVEVDKVLVADESRRSTKANAFFAGLGNTKRIVLFDTLVDNFPPAELETIVAHELGHYVNRDVPRLLLADIIKALVIFFAVNLVFISTNMLQAAGIGAFSELAVLPLIILLYSALSIITLPFANSYSRRREALADLFALDAAKKPLAQISAERRLVDAALDTETCHPLIEIVFRTHPSASRRMEMARSWGKSKSNL